MVLNSLLNIEENFIGTIIQNSLGIDNKLLKTSLLISDYKDTNGHYESSYQTVPHQILSIFTNAVFGIPD